MAGIIGIYGLVVSVLVANDLTQKLPLYTGFIQLGAGLAVGLAGLAAGYVYLGPLEPPFNAFLSILITFVYYSFAIGIVGDAGVRGTAQQPRLYVGMILILIFAEVLGKQLLIPRHICRWIALTGFYNTGLYGLIVALLMNSRSKATC